MRSKTNIATDVDRGLWLFAQIEMLTAELEQVEERLTQDALHRPEKHVPLTDPKREGRQFLAEGMDTTLPIILTADKLVQTFQANSDTEKRIKLAAGGKFGEFFRPISTWAAREKNGKKFRAQATEQLGDAAPDFIAACRQLDADGHPKSDIKVEWKAAATAAGLAAAGEGVAA